MFIAIEGPDGSGKSTQISLLYNWLQKNAKPCVVTREPGGTKLAENIRNLLLNQEGIEDPMTELLLLSAARRDHVNSLIKPAIQNGKIVLSDRFIASTLAYQGALKGLPISDILHIHNLTVDAYYPDITIVLTIAPTSIGKRLNLRSDNNHYDSLTLEKQKILCDFYRNLATHMPSVIINIDATASKEEVHQHILEQLKAYVSNS